MGQSASPITSADSTTLNPQTNGHSERGASDISWVLGRSLKQVANRKVSERRGLGPKQKPNRNGYG
ncbi:hypothetical protein ACE1B6_22925 [Aerosakkonemataceae cyanobacterium BLCC-F154]|uniref:Uncharacterized protein n=1 Tax=Floridaenema fluviatile BLCC-F154 TaxID=3153640 RepID=A0ABV4YH08_9CYAN